MLAPTDTADRIVYLSVGGPLPRRQSGMFVWSMVALQEIAVRFRTPRAMSVPVLARAPFYVDSAANGAGGPGLDGQLLLTADRGGQIAMAAVVDPSGSPELDAALLDAVTAADSAGVLPPLPDDHRGGSAALKLRVSTTRPKDREAAPLLRAMMPYARTTERPTPANKRFIRPPQYPPLLRERNIQGGVVAQFVIDTAGRPEMATLRFLRSSEPEFEYEVQRVIPSYRFKPAMVGGCAVRQLVQLPFQFRLSQIARGRTDW